jgi:putative ABC transport system permease protein
MLGELAAIVGLAIPVGMGLGYGLAALTSLGLDTELYRIPLIVAPRTWVFAGVTVALAAAFSGLVVRKRLDRLDLIAVLKTRE